MMLQILWCAFYIALFVIIICKAPFFRLPGITKIYTVLLFLLKVICGIFVWQLFISAYPASDAAIFFDESKVLYDTFFENTTAFFKIFFGIGDSPELQAIRAKMGIWKNTSGSFLIVDSRTMIRLNALFRFFSLGYFNVHAIFMCFLSFTGLAYLYKSFFSYFHNCPLLLIIACFAFPTVVFWSSTVLKEGILFLGMGLFLYHCQCGLRHNYSFKNCIGLLLGITLLIFIKIYILLALLPALIANFWIANSTYKWVILKYSLTHIFFFVLLLTGRFISPSLDFAKVINTKQTDFVNVAKGGMVAYHDTTFIYLHYDWREERLQLIAPNTYKLKKGYQYASFKWGKTDTVFIDASDTNSFTGLYMLVPARSAFNINKIKPNMLDILKNVPLAFVNVLIVPPLFTMNKAFSGIILIGNLILLISLFISLLFLKKKIPLAIILFCVSFIVILFSLIGLTTPVLGALVRYRIPGIPFLIILIGLLIDEQKINKVIFKMKRNFRRKESYSK